MGVKPTCREHRSTDKVDLWRTRTLDSLIRSIEYDAPTIDQNGRVPFGFDKVPRPVTIYMPLGKERVMKDALSVGAAAL
jgi:hypothetical protein